MPDLEQVRRWFAEDLRVIGHLGDQRVVDAFAAVPRERFAGPGPWRIRHLMDGYWSTPDDDPRRLYHNVLIALDETRGLNIGEPILWARHFDRIGLEGGDRVLQIGTGSGYYTAILAELVGRTGRVDGIEIDPPLAAAATRNLEGWPAAAIREGDAGQPIAGEWDLIVAFAGATAPHAWWLDALADGGHLLLPLTAGNLGLRGGFMLRVDRRGDALAARSAGWVGFYPCAGARNPDDEAALSAALGDPVGQQAVRSLRREAHDRDETCWLHRESWCLSKRELS
ncbi:MAG: methyltransferase [Reyranella sp.]|uniref:protein-L-isoaspartate O-methyltransferase family protein n=1 Tax=Reyranella sp. TaxID=1929291 RepID=UPI001AD00E41|nr:protein-L-isoaspartate(D-aspartate) O-methyltransferase [Reyranella sp.]MBN9088840.1 methyltransferase [Reyranella sp.]